MENKKIIGYRCKADREYQFTKGKIYKLRPGKNLWSYEAFIMLLNTANYLNKMYEKVDDEIWYFNTTDDELNTDYSDRIVYDSTIYFNSKQAINKALDILGEETIKLALKFN